MTERVNIGLVMGDAAGIGPEIALKTVADKSLDDRVSLYILGNVDIMMKMNDILGNPATVVPVAPSQVGEGEPDGGRSVARVVECDIDVNPDFKWGIADGVNGANTVNAIRRAFDYAGEGRLDGIVIGPLDKKALNLGGSKFADEAALMGDMTGSSTVKIIPKWNNIFRSSVVGHVRFSEIVANLTPDRIELSISRLGETMRDFGIENPRIGVAALNPHAGEGGEFGDEEKTILEPAIAKFAGGDLTVTGPFPCDTILTRAMRGEFEGIVFLYHDQGNLPLKAASFGESVLLYTGLPLPVTGVGHGVAYGRAGQGRADHINVLTAVNVAGEMAARRASRK